LRSRSLALSRTIRLSPAPVPVPLTPLLSLEPITLLILALALTITLTLLATLSTLLSGTPLEVLTAHHARTPLLTLVLTLVLALILSLALAAGTFTAVLLFLAGLENDRRGLAGDLDSALTALRDLERGRDGFTRRFDRLELDKGACFASDEFDRGDVAESGSGGAEGGLVDGVGTRGPASGPVGELVISSSFRLLWGKPVQEENHYSSP
jgi:hypothetical protein